MAIQIKKAVRERVFLKLVVMGPAGSGKTYGGVGLAKGLAPTGKVLVVDTENSSASYYADKWDFDVVDMHAPFTAQKYMEVLAEAVKLGYEVIVFDSLSHEWAGSGGTLDKKADIDRAKGEKWGNWQDAKKPHTLFKEAWLQAPIHVVATMRSKMEYVLELNEKGKQVPRKVGLAPIQDGDSEYEFGVAFEVDRDSHLATAAKDRTGLFDGRSFPLGEAIGQELAAWLATGAPMTVAEPDPSPTAAAAPVPAAAHPTQAAPASPATTGPSKPSSAAAPAQTAPSKPAASAVNPPAEAQRWPNALIELNAAMFKAGWSNDARMATAEEWKVKGPAALPELISLLNAGLPAQAPVDNPEWIAAMDELLQVSMGMPAATRKALVASFEADGPAALPILRVEIQKIRTADAAPTTVGAVLAQLPRTAGPEVDQASATFVDSVQPDTDEGAGGIDANQYAALNALILAYGINRDALRAYAFKAEKLLPGKNGPTLARFKASEFAALRTKLQNNKIAAGNETWSARTVRIINSTPTYAPVASAS